MSYKNYEGNCCCLDLEKWTNKKSIGLSPHNFRRAKKLTIFACTKPQNGVGSHVIDSSSNAIPQDSIHDKAPLQQIDGGFDHNPSSRYIRLHHIRMQFYSFGSLDLEIISLRYWWILLVMFNRLELISMASIEDNVVDKPMTNSGQIVCSDYVNHENINHTCFQPSHIGDSVSLHVYTKVRRALVGCFLSAPTSRTK